MAVLVGVRGPRAAPGEAGGLAQIWMAEQAGRGGAHGRAVAVRAPAPEQARGGLVPTGAAPQRGENLGWPSAVAAPGLLVVAGGESRRHVGPVEAAAGDQ